MLTSFDDYPVHQTSAPVAVPASGDPNHYDRYFFNGYSDDGALYFAAAMGAYPNREVIDAAFSVVWGGEQLSVHASGRCPLDRLRTEVGPIRVEVVEPLRVLRLAIDAPEHALRAELTFRARGAAVEEPHFFRRTGTRVIMDYTRLTQFGTWSGWLVVDDQRVEVEPGAVLGSRDRSWGIRPVGERTGGAPGPLPQFYWLWAPVNLPERCLHFDVNEDARGQRWHESGFVVPVGDGEAVAADEVRYAIEWVPGTRRARSCWYELATPDGELVRVTLEPLLDFQMLGLGYLHPDWGHGVWKGELAVAGERWRLPVDDPLSPFHLHVQALCRARTSAGEEGIGILEQLVIGPHGPSGFTGFADGATDT